MKNLKNKDAEQIRFLNGWRILFAVVLVLLVLVAPILTPQPAEAACPAPGGGYAGALNMLHDPTMLTIPMTHDAPQGNAGMFTAVANSSCG